jgi:hypothetical protein
MDMGFHRKWPNCFIDNILDYPRFGKGLTVHVLGRGGGSLQGPAPASRIVRR